jgi:hypothetical protein
MLLGQENALIGGDHARAVTLSERALDVARNLRDEDFAALAAGTYGVALGPDGTWGFSGTSSTTSDGFTTAVTITSLDANWVRLSAETTWSQSVDASGSVLLEAELTDWRTPVGGDWSTLTLEGSYVDDGSPLFNDVAVSGDYAFVTSEVSSGGDGLYVFDISDLAAPTRVASSFSLTDPAYDVAVKGSTLYVLVGDTNSEVRAYDVSSPSSLSASDLVASYNLPGQGRAISLAIEGDELYVGATYATQASREEFYTFDVSVPGDIELDDALEDAGTVSAIAVSGTSAYLANSADVSELGVYDVTDPENVVLAPGAGYNLTDSPDGTAIAIANSTVVLGRAAGDAIEELVLLTVPESGGVPTPPGPWYREIGARVNEIDVDILECAAFVANDADGRELEVINIQDTLLPRLTLHDSSTGAGRGVTYDAGLDRVFFVTNQALHIFAPAPGPWTCP